MTHKKSDFSYVLLVAIVILVLLGFYSTFVSPLGKTNQGKITYLDSEAKFELQYPENFELNKNTNEVGGIGDINIYPKGSTNEFDPQFIEIIYQNEETGMELKDQASSFLKGVPSDQLKKVAKSDFEMIQYVESKGVGERKSYDFFISNGKFVAAIFYQRRFDSENPLTLIDNSAFYSIYIGVLNSIKTNIY
ncbi:MAG: hypothetical protein NTZ65_01900 [Candidatus Berkelbacteria bacterium]|nr:hypothetical protein [Candidatus Berkelbacteria bacterium]